MTPEGGCEYGQANRTFIEELRGGMDRIEKKIDNELMHRWPQGISIMIALLSSLVVGLITYIVTKG